MMRQKFLHRVEGGGTKSYNDRDLWCYQVYNDGGGGGTTSDDVGGGWSY